MLKFQLHIIARTDDITSLEMNDLRSHDTFGELALQTKVSWRKNLMEERACLDQLQSGAADTDLCILLALACYLESRMTTNRNGRYLFGERDDEFEPDRASERYCRTLRQCWCDPEFLELMAKVKGSLRSHINCKFPATWCDENGSSDPEVEIRGRWKGNNNGRVVNRHISVEQLPTDAKLAGILAVDGTVRFKLKADIHVSNSFIHGIVTPKMHEQFGADKATPSLMCWRCHFYGHVMNPLWLTWLIMLSGSGSRKENIVSAVPAHKPITPSSKCHCTFLVLKTKFSTKTTLHWVTSRPPERVLTPQKRLSSLASFK
jgi:hypothetical protein